MLFFCFFYAKEAVGAIEANGVIMSVEVIETTEILRTTKILKINNMRARITIFRCFEKTNITHDSWNLSESLPTLRTEAVEDRDVIFYPNWRVIRKKYATQDSQTTLKPDLFMHISFSQSKLKYKCLLWDTLYLCNVGTNFVKIDMFPLTAWLLPIDYLLDFVLEKLTMRKI